MAKDKEVLKQASKLLNPQKMDPCHHPYLLIKKRTGEKVCAACGRTIYFKC